VRRRRPPKIIVLDMDSSVGDIEQRVLRCGNVRSADGWRALLEPVIGRYRDRLKRLYFRGLRQS
jgi:hypothetical protein